MENVDEWTVIKNVGHKPYAIKRYPQSHSKIIVTNDDAHNLTEPDFITIIDTEKAILGDPDSIEAKILVRDRPMGLEISDDEKYAFVACMDGKSVQKSI